MKRSNVWIHIGLATIFVVIAAVAGKINRTDFSSIGMDREVSVDPAAAPVRTISESEPEVLVRFRQGVSLDQIKRLAASNNDRLEDEIEIVNGLVAIDDLETGLASGRGVRAVGGTGRLGIELGVVAGLAVGGHGGVEIDQLRVTVQTLVEGRREVGSPFPPRLRRRPRRGQSRSRPARCPSPRSADSR